ncbi:hypothetical protein [Gordonia sp. (in: high G+C Gram-positive bacteria)]|uniref:hypothetical protein n=1 Tax=Gordonia sp. (in: high G+C Gram-positive bacteria) TaxID=84139 RepID=UPI003342CAAA
MTGVLILALAGAEPDRLADLLRKSGVEVATEGYGAAIVAVDLSSDIGFEERAMLDRLASEAVPTALVAGGVQRNPDWPEAMARAREELDPERHLAVFAVATDDGGGVEALVAWCMQPDTGPPVRRPDTPTPVVRLDGSARRSSGPPRADRLAGLRAGVAAARTETVTAARESVQALAVAADRACGTLGRRDAAVYTAWLTDSISTVELSAEAELDDRLHQVRRVATIGLTGVDAGQMASEPALRPPPPPLHRTAGGEDAVVLLLGVSAGFGIGRMLVAPIVDGWFLGGLVTAAVGLAIAAWIVGVRRTAAVRAALRRWTADTVGLSRTALEHRLVARVGTVEAHVSREIWNRMPSRRV